MSDSPAASPAIALVGKESWRFLLGAEIDLVGILSCQDGRFERAVKVLKKIRKLAKELMSLDGIAKDEIESHAYEGKLKRAAKVRRELDNMAEDLYRFVQDEKSADLDVFFRK